MSIINFLQAKLFMKGYVIMRLYNYSKFIECLYTDVLPPYHPYLIILENS